MMPTIESTRRDLRPFSRHDLCYDTRNFREAPNSKVDPMMTFGEWLRGIRKKNNMTLEEFGERIGMTHPTVSRYEQNKQRPKKSTVLKIAAIMGEKPLDGLSAAGFIHNSEVDEHGNEGPALRQVQIGELRGKPMYALIPADAGEDEIKNIRRAVEIVLREDS